MQELPGGLGKLTIFHTGCRSSHTFPQQPTHTYSISLRQCRQILSFVNPRLRVFWKSFMRSPPPTIWEKPRCSEGPWTLGVRLHFCSNLVEAKYASMQIVRCRCLLYCKKNSDEACSHNSGFWGWQWILILNGLTACLGLLQALPCVHVFQLLLSLNKLRVNIHADGKCLCTSLRVGTHKTKSDKLASAFAIFPNPS